MKIAIVAPIATADVAHLPGAAAATAPSVLDRFSRASVAAATEAIDLELLSQRTTRMVPA